MQAGKVPQTSVCFFQVGLEQECNVAVCLVAELNLIAEYREPKVGATAPQLPCPREHGPADLRIARDDPPVQEAELHPQVLSGHGEDLGRRPDRMVEADSFVPDRVPDIVGDLRHVASLAVDEHHVEVAVGAELALGRILRPPGGLYPSGPLLWRLRQQFTELVVGRMAVGNAELQALKSRVCQQRLTFSAE